MLSTALTYMFNVLFNQTWGPCIAHSRTSDAFDIHLVSELVPSFHKLVTFQSFCPHFLKIYAISSIKQSFSLVDSASDSFWSINLMLVVEVSWFHRCIVVIRKVCEATQIIDVCGKISLLRVNSGKHRDINFVCFQCRATQIKLGRSELLLVLYSITDFVRF